MVRVYLIFQSQIRFIKLYHYLVQERSASPYNLLLPISLNVNTLNSTAANAGTTFTAFNSVSASFATTSLRIDHNLTNLSRVKPRFLRRLSPIGPLLPRPATRHRVNYLPPPPGHASRPEMDLQWTESC